jgi:hypothetical protein
MDTQVQQTEETPTRVLLSIDKSEKEQILVRDTIFKDKEYIDIRLFNKRGQGDFLPTKKGVTLPKATMKELLKGLIKVKM